MASSENSKRKDSSGFKINLLNRIKILDSQETGLSKLNVEGQ